MNIVGERRKKKKKKKRRRTKKRQRHRQSERERGEERNKQILRNWGKLRLHKLKMDGVHAVTPLARYVCLTIN